MLLSSMKDVLTIFCAVSAALLALSGCGGRNDEAGGQAGSAPEAATECAAEDVSALPPGFSPDSLMAVDGKVGRGEFFSTLLMRLGMSASEAYALSAACDTVFDVRSLRVGNAYTAYYSDPVSSPDRSGSDSASDRDGSSPEWLVYWQDRVHGVVFSCRPPYGVTKIAKEISEVSRYADVTITSSLWEDMLEAGVSPLLILNLSDIYAWTVDFFGLQKGDRFRVFYDEKTCDGEVIAVDTVRYAVFTHAGEDFPAVMFNQGDGGNVYWNEKGESMRKAFLKAPLHYSRISSGFSYARRHPVTRRVQPHTGVDYAAPAGTPVMTIGDGVVTSRRYEGAGGNVVRIRHNSIYSTAYLHLSRYAPGLQVGKRVRQGEVIGYVGSTGRSTGPHLDFLVWKNGSPINPLKMESPPAEPLKPESKDAFSAVVGAYEHRLDSLEAIPVAERLFGLF